MVTEGTEQPDGAGEGEAQAAGRREGEVGGQVQEAKARASPATSHSQGLTALTLTLITAPPPPAPPNLGEEGSVFQELLEPSPPPRALESRSSYLHGWEVRGSPTWCPGAEG